MQPGMEKLKKFFKKDSFAGHCGIKLLEVSEGYAKAGIDITPDHLNGAGTVHEGVIFTLADLAFAVAGNTHETVAVAIHINISFIKTVNKGPLYVQAKETSINPKLATYDIRVTDDAGNLIALFNGQAYRKEKKLDEL